MLLHVLSQAVPFANIFTVNGHPEFLEDGRIFGRAFEQQLREFGQILATNIIVTLEKGVS